MKIAITGSLGNIARPLAERLIKAGHQVTIISSSENKKAVIEEIGATAAIGSIADLAFLIKAFTGADIVYTMVPDQMQSNDYIAYTRQTIQNYADAITATRVTQVVNLSSNGAHLPKGAGLISAMYYAEKILNNLEGIIIKHLRPASFYFNYYRSIPMIKNAGILGANYPADTKLLLAHPLDIADAAFEEMTTPFTASHVRFVASDEKTSGEVTRLLGNAIGKPDLQWVEFTNDQLIAGILQSGHVSQHFAENLVEMTAAIGSGKLYEEFYKHRPALGSRKFEEFAVEFAKVYQKS